MEWKLGKSHTNVWYMLENFFLRVDQKQCGQHAKLPFSCMEWKLGKSHTNVWYMLETWFFSRSSKIDPEYVTGGFIAAPNAIMVFRVNILSAIDVDTTTSVLMFAFIASVAITMSGVSDLHRVRRYYCCHIFTKAVGITAVRNAKRKVA
jgi:hypothetical protein